MHIVFGDGKIAVSVALQEDNPMLVLEEWAEGRNIGETIPNRRAGMKVPADELEKALLVLEFKSSESIEIVIAQLQALLDTLIQRRKGGNVPRAVEDH